MNDLNFMKRALALAKKARGFTSPNPLVGAVIVKNGKILSQGYHHQAGQPHAEIEALKKINFKAKGATLYCNLEPCFHQGRTPPCVHQVIQSGIKRVVISHGDPNPLVAGRSIKLLKKKGIKVDVGLMAKEALELNKYFVKWIYENKPYVILKVATSADGMVGLKKQKKGRPLQISSKESQKLVHQLRSHVDAVMVGGNTVRLDDPQLNVRLIKKAHQPIRIVLSSRKTLPKKSKILNSKGGLIWVVHPKKSSKQINLKSLCLFLGAQNITSILVEAGPKLYTSFLKSGCVDEMIHIVSEKIVGSKGLLLPKFCGNPMKLASVENIGTDVIFNYRK